MSTESQSQFEARIIHWFERSEPITLHPFLVRLRSERPNLQHLWRLLANFQISISRHFSRHLASTAGRVDDDRIRCILAEQLYDEMGRGRFEAAHTNLFAKMMNLLEPWRPTTPEDRALAPGLRIVPELAAIYGDPDVNQALGAIIVGEVVAKQLDLFLAEEFQRQDEINPAKLEWLTLHAELETVHADASVELARLIPPTGHEAALRGAQRLYRLGWSFLDDIYAQCYSAT
ncbi:MAG TPA: iron-containing redox enzyme family protein [Polyangiaceae bacterium]|jgi:pyrroloquinoline quinone (PQQ) biosynthesis protein C|nr:iron-containing redox enzyme family protein [Polyangiaceae bacterium]